jgi:hypothetical protein
MSERLMNSNRVYHPIGSVENRREILMGLSPMLTDADNQRKQEVEACEVYTKCRSSKVRSRNAYEYIDLESSRVIEFAEYERRYIRYITETKLNRQQNYSLQLQPLLVTFRFPVYQHPENKENISAQSLSESLVNPPTKTLKKRKLATNVLASHEDAIGTGHKSNSNRRETLSPGTVRKLLIEKVEIVMSPQSEGSQTVEAQSVPSFPTDSTCSPTTSKYPVSTDQCELLKSVSPIKDIDLISFDDDFSSDIGGNSSLLSSCTKLKTSSVVRRSTLSPSVARLVAMEFIAEENEISASATVSSDMPDDAVTSAAIDDLLNSPVETSSSLESTVPSEIQSPFESDCIVAKEDKIEIESLDVEMIGSCEPTVTTSDLENIEIQFVEIPMEALIPIEIPVEYELSIASEVHSMIATSPTRRFFGRKSEGNIVNRGLEILDGSASELEAFELLESFVSGALLAKSMEARSPHFFSPERNVCRPMGSSAKKIVQPTFPSMETSNEADIVPASSLIHSVVDKDEIKSLDEDLGEIDEEEWERRASQRMKDRFAAARWQYLWEIVSAQAANKAINEARKKQKLSL